MKILLLDLGFNIKEIMLGVFLFSYLVKIERKEFNTSQTSFLILKTNKANSLAILESPSIRLSDERTT